MTLNNPLLHHRRSIRLTGYDYALPGAYFITLVSFDRDEIFGQIKDSVMQLSALGQIVREEWLRSATVRGEIHLYEDEFVIMPNHIHGIVWIVNPVGADGVRPNVVSVNRGASLAPLPKPPLPKPPLQPIPPLKPIPRRMFKPVSPTTALQRKPRSLSSFVAGYKASVTSRGLHELDITWIWHRNYYDHIIRNEQDFMKIWNYIDSNPQRYKDDNLNPTQKTDLSPGDDKNK